MAYFEYGKTEMDFLSAADENMRRLIENTGHIYRKTYDDLFQCVASSIAGQQISGKALETVWRRLTVLCGGEVTAEKVAELLPGEIKSCGMSMKKAAWIKSFADALAGGKFDADSVAGMSDGDVVAALRAFDGIGQWTAEMALIFALKRPDVFSYGDLGIRKGLMKLIGSASIDRKIFEVYRKKFSPYGTVASFYLWALASGDAVI